MMTSPTSLGEKLDTNKLNFWEKLLVTVSPSTAEKVFSFVKEKQEKIQTAKTEAELDSLKLGIVPAVTAATTPTETAEKPSTTTTTTETTTTEENKVEEPSDEKEKKAKEDAEKLNEKTQESKNKKENIAT